MTISAAILLPMNPLLLSRRSLLGLLPLALSLPAMAQAKPYEARLFSAGFDGTRHMGGLHLRLAPGWKTYWRVPGEGGIPPIIEAKGVNVGEFSFDCPLPHRMTGGDGETIGYKDEVVFPWSLTPADAARPVEVTVSAFIGVCQTICIPVPAEADFTLPPAVMATRETALLAQWQALVPRQQVLVTKAMAGEENGKVFLELGLNSAAADIFVEGSSLHFFASPLWGDERRTARLAVYGAKSADELRGTDLRITVDVNGAGLEQSVTVS